MAQASVWTTDSVELHDGRVYSGLIESEDRAWLYLTEIHRPTGRPMHLVVRPIEQSSIVRVVRLDAEERSELRRRLDHFRNRARIEAGRMQAVQLELTQREGTRYRHYVGKWFTLDSSVDEDTTRRMIVRVEQVFTAYRQVLPPRTQPQRPLRIVVLGSLEEYREYLRRLGLSLDNRAVFLREANLIVAGSPLTRYQAELAKVNQEHARLLDELALLEDRLRQRLADVSRQLQKQGRHRSEIARLLVGEKGRSHRKIDAKRAELRRYDRQNAKAFDEVTAEMFRHLYHEAFHAYLENYVYPRHNHDVPVWLDEGLAMVFEEGILEAETFRIDAPNKPALRQLRADLDGGRAPSLRALLQADAGEFLVGAGGPSKKSSRYYAAAWGLAYYLTFELQVIGSDALVEYLASEAGGTSPEKRIEKLTGVPLDTLRRRWREYILALP